MDIPAVGGAASAPSEWVLRWARALPPAGRVLDLACGAGRHAGWLAAQGHAVLAVDIDVSRVPPHPQIEVLAADLEGPDWPLAGRLFDGVVVTNYLHRPRFDSLLALVRPGGLLIYETFAQGNERFGRPRNPDFLLAPGELLLRIGDAFEPLGFEEATVRLPQPAVVQRLCARRRAAQPAGGAGQAGR